MTCDPGWPWALRYGISSEALMPFSGTASIAGLPRDSQSCCVAAGICARSRKRIVASSPGRPCSSCPVGVNENRNGVEAAVLVACGCTSTSSGAYHHLSGEIRSGQIGPGPSICG